MSRSAEIALLLSGEKEIITYANEKLRVFPRSRTLARVRLMFAVELLFGKKGIPDERGDTHSHAILRSPCSQHKSL